MDILTILFFLLGSILIAFFQLLAERLPKNKTILGRSECDNCHHQLRFIDVLPLFGYIINLGKCHYCKKKVSIRYPLIELFSGLIFAFLYELIGLSLELIVAYVLFIVLAIESITDILYRIVLDRVWIIGVIILIVIRIIQATFLEYLLSSAILFTFLLLVSIIAAKVMKREALGGGDVKLYVFIGFALTIWNNILSLFLACVIALAFALIFKKYRNYIPLVPFIAISSMICFLFGNQIIDWYLSLFGM